MLKEYSVVNFIVEGYMKMCSCSKVLVVNEFDHICNEIKFLLEEQGFDVCCLSNVNMILDHVREQQIDFIITDSLEPTIDGIDLIVKIKQFNPNIKFITINNTNQNKNENLLQRVGRFVPH